LDTQKKQAHNFKSGKTLILLFLVCLSGILVTIADTNVELFCIPKLTRVFEISNEELFFIYSVVFTFINIYLLWYSRNVERSVSKKKTILFVMIIINQLLIAFLLFAIYGQVKKMSLYSNSLLYTVIYASLISSSGFLAISGIQFLSWFVRNRNYLVFLYALVMVFLVVNALIGLFYLYQVSLSQNLIIKYSSCRVMFASLFNVNPDLNIALSNIYDITSIVSFILAWLASVLMLKQYARRIKFAYWILVSLPLIFFLSRYEVGLYYLLSSQASNIMQAFSLATNIYGYESLERIIKANLQLGGVFFGIVFFAVALKVQNRDDLRKTLILTGIGLLFLFASKDISALILSSYPPLGAVSFGFIGLASYLIFLGIYSTAKLASRDRKFQADLRTRIENDVALLKSISLSQDQKNKENQMKHLIGLSAQWEEENNEDMSLEEIRELLKDVVSEIKVAHMKTKKA
jgi:hypothetical protein